MARFIITGEYKDKATKDARKGLKNLTKDTGTFAKLSKKYYAAATAAAGYYAQKILKESIKNALDDEKSQRVLALTLQNVAGATDAAVIATEQQISAMQAAYGVMDDKLRPALARLARSSGSASQAAYDLKLALDISAATGKNLDAVTNALGKAIDGNYASLQRLGLGLDKSIIATKDQKKIFGELRKTFAGFAANEAATTEGKFRRIAVAADEAKEIIGVALIDSINDIVNTQGGVDGLTSSFNDLAYAVADTIRGIAVLTDKIGSLSKGLKIDLVGAIPVLGGWLRGFQAVGKQQRINLALQTSTTKQIISARNAEMVALNTKKKATYEANTASSKTIEQLIAEEMARKAGFKITEDIDSIQTVAAAKRLAEAREYKAEVLEAAQAQFDAVKNNYDLLNAVWETQLTAFDAFLAALKTKAAQAQIAVTYQGTGAGSAPSATNPIGPYLPEPSTPSFTGGMGAAANIPVAGVASTINVNVNAGAVGSEQYLADVIAQSLAQATRLGLSITPSGYIGSP